MYPNHYELEKLMDQHNRRLEQINRKGWWNRQPREESKPSPNSKAPAAAPAPSAGTSPGKENGICLQA